MKPGHLRVLASSRALGVCVLALAACTRRPITATPVADPPEAQPQLVLMSDAAMATLYEEAGFPDIREFRRVRLGPHWADRFAPPAWAWRVPNRRNVLHLVFDSLREERMASNAGGALYLGRSLRERVPGPLRSPGPHRVATRLPLLATTEFASFAEELTGKLKLTAEVHADHERSTLTWFLYGRWAQMQDRPELAAQAFERALAAVPRAPGRRPHASFEGTLRSQIQSHLLSQVQQRRSDWAPWESLVAESRRALAIAPDSEQAPKIRALVQELEHAQRDSERALHELSGVIGLNGTRPTTKAELPVEALVRSLVDEAGAPWDWKQPSNSADSTFWHVFRLGEVALPNLRAHFSDTHRSRCGVTVGQLSVLAASLILGQHPRELAPEVPLIEALGHDLFWESMLSVTELHVQRPRDPAPPGATLPPLAVLPAGQSWPLAGLYPQPGFTRALAYRESQGEVAASASAAWVPAGARPEPWEREANEELRGPALQDGPHTYAVLDWRKEASRDRVRLLCESASYRLGLWVQSSSLARTNSSEVTLFATQASAKTLRAATLDVQLASPGLWVEAGRELALGRTRGVVRSASYEDESLKAELWIDNDALAPVWFDLPPAPRPSPQTQGRLVGASIEFRAQPRGRVFATLTKTWDEDRRVELLASKGTARLVRFQRFDSLLTGWIDATAYESLAPSLGNTGLIGKGGGGGHGFANTPWTDLPKGTRLVEAYSGEVIGELTWDTSLHCDAPCDEATPQVYVRACGDRLRVRALPPG